MNKPILETRENSLRLPQAIAETRVRLEDVARQLEDILHDEPMMVETPIEVESAMQSIAQAIDVTLRRLKSVASARAPSPAPPGGPTRQQGQFLAFISRYIMGNSARVAPSHADLQRFFNLTAPSVNSMLVRLEQRGFIRRLPRQARAIEITIDPNLIPPLERPFKY